MPTVKRSKQQGRPSNALRDRVIAGAAIALVAATLGFFSFKTLSQPNSDEVFEQMLASNLSTAKYKATTDLESSSSSISIDATDVENPKVLTDITTKAPNGLTTNMQYYSTFRDQSVRYSPITFASTEVDVPENKELANKWAQIRKDGTLVKGSGATLHAIGDANMHFFNGLAMGNFSKVDKQDLLTFMQEKPLYDRTGEGVKKEKLHGRDVFVYKTTLNDENVLQFNEKIGDIVGVQPKYLKERIRENENITYYVDIKTKRPIRAVSTVGEMTFTTDISYENIKLPNTPQPQIDLKRLIDLLIALSDNYEYETEEQATAPSYPEDETMRPGDAAPVAESMDSGVLPIDGTIRLE